MPTFRPGDVVRVPFPSTDRPIRQWRPALVVAAGALTDDHGLLWVNMITSAENRSWSDDVSLDFAAAGLPAASVVRVRKLATIEASDAEMVGRIGESEFSEVLRRIAGVLNI